MKKPNSTKAGEWPDQKVISLIRVSTAEQAGEWKSGVTRQREANQLAAKITGLPIEHEVLAIDVSGRHVREDPQFLKLFADMRRPDIAGIYVAEHSRLFRPEFGADYAILDEFAKAKKRIWVAGQMIDPSTNEGNMSLVINGLMSGQELKLIKQRFTQGRDKARRMGRVGQCAKSTMPRGVSYITSRGPDDKVNAWRYEIDPEEGAKVKLAYRMLLDGYSFAQIGERIGRDDSSVRGLLSNPIWCGRRQYIYRAGDIETPSPSTGKKVRRTVLRDDPYEVELFGAARMGPDGPIKLAEFPRLISDEMFAHAQQVLAERTTQWRKAKMKRDPARERPILTGVGRCRCGAALYYVHAKRPEWNRYNCATRFDKKREHCGAPSVACALIDGAVHDMIRNLANPKYVRRNMQQVIALQAAGDPGKAARERSMRGLAAQRPRINDMYQAGRIDKADYMARLRRLDAQLRELEAQTPQVPETVTPEQIAATVAMAAVNFNLAPPAQQRDWLMRMFREITIDPDGERIGSVTLKQRFSELSDGLNVSAHRPTPRQIKCAFPSDIRLVLDKAS